MQINLDCSQHCLETATRRLYNKLISQYFKSKENKGLIETQIEMLKKSLESFDFPKLRSTYPELAGHGSGKVALSEKNDSLILLTDRGKIIPFIHTA